jgi:tyrosine-protein kinase Etk/Wzc
MTDLNDIIINKEKRTVIDPNKLITILYKRWYIVAISVLVCFFITYLQLRYTKPLYTASITLKLDDEKPSQMSDLFKYGRTTGKFDNFLKTESEVIKSKAYAEKTLSSMNYEYSYFQKGKIVTTQLYPNPYFVIKTIIEDSSDAYHTFNIEFITTKTFRLVNSQNKKNPPTYHVYDTIQLNENLIQVIPQWSGQEHVVNMEPVICIKQNVKNLAPSFASGLNVEIVKGTSLLELQLTNEVPQLASDYLNAFALFYIKETINNKSLAAQQTIDFIDRQLFDLAAKVQQSEYKLADLKSKNNGVEIEEVGRSQLEKLSNLESEKNILLINQDVMRKLQKSIAESKEGPVNFVIFDREDAESLPQLLESFNQLMLERISILQKNTPMSPLAIENETKIKETRTILLKTIKGVNEKLDRKIAFADKRLNEINEVLGSIPMRQRMLINISRDFKVNEKVYTYLFEKKLETSISKSSITPNATIITRAETPVTPIFPNKNRSYMVALLLGLSFGVGFIGISRIIYQKIPDKETIETISQTPVLGVVKKINNVDNEYEIHTFKNPKSVFSESIRGIRTGISFIAKGQEKKVICVTSTVSGEGKTFCTINLAASFTLLNKKVVIIGCDLRRPKVHLSFNNLTNSIGLTTFLIGKSSLDQIIQKTIYDNLDVITAGPTPPNPSELLQTDEMRDLIETLKEKYDYILIDSAPVGLVSDSLTIMELSDINLYIIRAQYSKRDFALIPDRLKTDSDIKNLYTILNSYDNSAVIYSSIYKNDYGGYYSGGGYYYYGGYYGKGGYGYYGKRYNDSYYSGYYSEDEDDHNHENANWFLGIFKRLFKKRR